MNFLKLFWRNLWKNKTYSSLNILGLALGFVGFILSYQYINRETSYDTWNPNYNQIYLVGLTMHGAYTDQTPSTFARAIQENFPEVIRAGRRIDHFYGNYPVFGEETAYVRRAVLIDSAAARIFAVHAKGGPLYKSAEQTEATLVTQQLANRLFPHDQSFDTPKHVPVLSLELGIQERIYGISQERKPSVLTYDLLFIREVGGEGDLHTYQTYIETKPGSDPALLEKKLGELFKAEISKQHHNTASTFANGTVYLDPLSHLHLRPKHGSSTPYLMVWVLGILSVVILAIAAANFTNLIFAQADRRAKEIALKKVFGSNRRVIAWQFIGEIFYQCLLAAAIAFLCINLTGNVAQKWFNDDLLRHINSGTTVWQLVVAIIFTTLIAGVYPALNLSGYKPALLLKGGLHTRPQRTMFRQSLLFFQFVIALIFISGVLVVRDQVHYMRESDKGFEPAQVINFKSIGLYYDSKPQGSFFDFKMRLRQHPHIAYVAAASNIPGDSNMPPKKQFRYVDQYAELDHIGIDVDYFKTLNIAVLQGKGEISLAKLLDTSMHYAVINETAAKRWGLKDPIGAKISGCSLDFSIVGVVQDNKAYGFERAAAPTLYSFKDECGPGHFKTTLMVKTSAGKTKEAIKAVEQEWSKNPHAEALPLDYTFMDMQYTSLHERQERLEQVMYGFSGLSLFIAMLGLFSMSAYQIHARQKEMSIRKVLGASARDLFIQLNKPFLRITLGAGLVAIPITTLLLRHWLGNFAYKSPINPWNFVLVVLIVILLLLLTVCHQTLRSARAKPVDNLRDE
ncbi:ABC transporter permease [Sphingobacterium suaedae]|uniref:FtsX-like permease family protein n=1 Tax=Sphingobacterium suaedae TaxID=1686402 RepID=A0ABW5KH82_9SPHI